MPNEWHNYDEFIEEVQTHGEIESREDAERATQVILETFAERLSGGEASDLVAQLPE